jgi:putative flippase GtrA
MKLVIKYGLFACIAIACNLFTQDAMLKIYKYDYLILISMIVGTVVGLVVKYILDKKYIFYYRTENLKGDFRTFIFYSAIGAFLTLIFWGFEMGFEYIFHDKNMRYVGAVIGLVIGYILKYQLDKKYVFKR